MDYSGEVGDADRQQPVLVPVATMEQARHTPTALLGCGHHGFWYIQPLNPLDFKPQIRRVLHDQIG